MKQSRFTDEHIIGFLKQADAHSPHFDSTWQTHTKRLYREFQWKVQRQILE